MLRRKSTRLVTLLVALFFSVATTAFLAHVHDGKADHAERFTCDLCLQMAGAAGTPSLPKCDPPSTTVVAFLTQEREQVAARTPIVRAQRSRAPPSAIAS